MPRLVPASITNLLAKRKEASAVRFLESNLSPAGAAILSFMGKKPRDFIQKEDRSVIPERITRYTDLIEPQYNPWQLQELYETQWVVRMCVDKLVRETTRQGWKFKPKYEVKCDTCQTEYDYLPLSGKCPSCVPPYENRQKNIGETNATSASTSTSVEQGHLSEPDPGETEHAEEFLSHPNPDGLTTDDILKRAVKDLLIFDDFFQSVALNKETEGDYWERLQLFPEDARMMRIQADEKGRLGGKTFCQVCEDNKSPGSTTMLYPPEDIGKTCPGCANGKLTPMAYAQVKGAQPVTAWSKQEIVHGNLWAIGSRLFGTPKLWAIQTQVVAMALIDRFQKDAFDKSSTPKNIFVVKGIDRNSLNAVLKQHEQAKAINPMASMWIPLPPVQQGQAQFGIDKIPGLDSPLITGSLAFQEFYMKAICYTFGVSPSAIGVETPGRLGTGAAGIEQHDVTPETINEIQRQVSETFDQFLKRFFPEIEDWYFSLETAHEKETLDEWTVKKLMFDTAKVAVDAGFDVEVGEDGEPSISGHGKQAAPASPFGGGPANPFSGMGQTKASAVETRSTAADNLTKLLRKFTPPAGIGEVGAKVYAECRQRWVDAHPKDAENQGNKSQCAAVAWTVQHKHSNKATDEDIEKANRFQATIKQAGKDYKEQLDAFSQRIFSSLKADFDDVLVPNLPDSQVDADLKMTLIGRTKRILDHYLIEGERLATDAAAYLYHLGRKEASTDKNLVIKQDPSQEATDNSRKRTIEAMRNTLYWGDKDSYLQKISDIMDQGITENWSTDQLARELQKQMDPDKEHFSSYMWERIARTESASYVIQGTIDGYSDFGVPLLKRIVASNATDDLCLPFAGAVYKIDDADSVIPAHPNCRCAFAPYFGDPSEALDSFDVIHNL